MLHVKLCLFNMKHASHLPNIPEQCHAVDVVDKGVIESQQEMQPHEPEVQVFVTADNSSLQELLEITLCRDPPDASRGMPREDLPNASRDSSDASRGKSDASRGKSDASRRMPREGNLEEAEPWRESLQQSHKSIVELKELPAHLKYLFLEEEKNSPCDNQLCT